jgi:hypothetical protein
MPAFAAQSLYERACEYMELETRVEVLNVRFQVSSAGEALYPGVGTAERHYTLNQERHYTLVWARLRDTIPSIRGGTIPWCGHG